MPKLEVTVERCHLLRIPGRGSVRPRVHVTVDDQFKFQTHTGSSHRSQFDETFVVGNTHHLAIIELEVYDTSDPTGFLPGLGHIMGVDKLALQLAKSNHMTSHNVKGNLVVGDGGDAGGGGLSGPAVPPPLLLGKCYACVRRLVHGMPVRRTLVLSRLTAPHGGKNSTSRGTSDDDDLGNLMNNMMCDDLQGGIAGYVTVRLESDALGKSPRTLRLQPAMEENTMRQLTRLLLVHDRPKLAVMDLMMGNIRDPSERVVDGGGTESLILSPTSADGDSASGVLVLPGHTQEERELLAFEALTIGFESFDGFIQRMCLVYGVHAVPPVRRVSVRVDGCTGFDRDEHNLSVIGSDSVYVVLRTSSQDFVTDTSSLQSTIVFTEGNCTDFDIVDPENAEITLVVMGRNSSKHYEIGRASASTAPLARQHSSLRNLFLCNFENPFDLRVAGVLHLALCPLDFGFVPPNRIHEVDSFYDRLGRFFRRYSPARLPHVDAIIRHRAQRVDELEAYMQNEVVVHGREPGSVQLVITVGSIASLRESPEVEVDRCRVRVRVTMGSATVMTRPKEVRRFAATKFDESYVFDVVRETDMIRIEVVRASDPSTVYGRVDFTCLNTQRGAENKRVFYLVGNACTQDAFLSGTVRVKLYSDQVGHRYVIDEDLERMYAGRLQRYSFRRIPESLHRLNLAIATVYDLETFMSELTLRYGAEDPTHAIYFTVIGCRDLEPRFGGISPYVVVRVGIDAYQTRYVKDSREPDFFEYCEFMFDRPADNSITLVVMDHSDLGRDEEVGRAVIPLSDVRLGQQYHDFLPVQAPSKRSGFKTVGTVGFKFTVVDLKLIDRTRVSLVARKAGASHSRSDSGGTPAGNGVYASAAAEASQKRGKGGGWLGRRMYGLRHRMMTPFLMMNRTVGLASGGGGGNGPGAGGGGGVNVMVNESFSGRQASEISTEVVSDAGSQASSGNVVAAPTRNLMDEGEIGIDEFVAPVDFEGLNSSVISTDSSSSSYGSDSDSDGSNYSRGATSEGSSPSSGDESEGEGEGSQHQQHHHRHHRRSPARGRFRTPRSPGEGEDDDGSDDEVAGEVLPSSHTSSGRRILLSPLSTSPLPVPLPARRESTKPQLHVRLLYCRDLAATGRRPPSPYVLLATNSATKRSEIAFDTVNPEYNEEFVFTVSRRGFGDTLSVIVLTDTPYGSKVLGHCVLSLNNVQRDVARTRWVSLVHNPFQSTAVQQGSVCLSLRATNFGLRYLPSIDAENRLRERISDYLKTSCPAKLFLLEYFVGLYAESDSFLFPKQAIFKDKGGKSAAIVATIKCVTHLNPDQTRFAEGVATVKLRVMGSTKLKAKAVGVQGIFTFNQSSTFTVKNPAATAVRIKVFLNGGKKAGECYISLADLRENQAKERTHFLVMNSRSGNPRPSGLITVGLTSPNYGSASTAPTATEEERYARMCRFFYYYLPSELVTADIRYVNTLNVDAYLKQLVERYGPEPQELEAVVTVSSFTPAFTFPVQPYFVLHCGLEEFRSSVLQSAEVAASPSHCARPGYVFDESFNIPVGIPSLEEVGLILYNHTSAKDAEIGRLSIPLTGLARGRENTTHTPVVYRNGTRNAEIRGSIVVSVRPINFGVGAGTWGSSTTSPTLASATTSVGTPAGGGGGAREDFGRTTTSVMFTMDESGALQMQSGLSAERAAAVLHSRQNSFLNSLTTPLVPRGAAAAAASATTVPGSLAATTGGAAIFADPATPLDAPSAGAADVAAGDRSRSSASISSAHKEQRSTATAATADSALRHTYNGRTGEDLLGPPRARMGSVDVGPETSTPALRITVARFEGLQVDRDVYLRITCDGEEVLTTKPIPPKQLTEVRGCAFKFTKWADFNTAVYTMKIGTRHLFHNETICYVDFCLNRLRLGERREKLLRLYSPSGVFLGRCCVVFEMPPEARLPEGRLRSFKNRDLEPLLDDLASLVHKYSPKDLRRLDVTFNRSGDVRKLHSLLRMQLAPRAIATIYVIVRALELVEPHDGSDRLSVAASMNGYVEASERRPPGSTAVHPYAARRQDVVSLEYAPIRVDITPSKTGAMVMMLSVRWAEGGGLGRSREREVGRTEVSLKALLTPQLYSMFEDITMPIVNVRHASNKVHASVSGKITFSLHPVMYESYPSAVRFPSASVEGVNQQFVRYYFERICRFLTQYDAISLVNIHVVVFHNYVANNRWSAGLAQFFSDLVVRWGPEPEPAAAGSLNHTATSLTLAASFGGGGGGGGGGGASTAAGATVTAAQQLAHLRRDSTDVPHRFTSGDGDGQSGRSKGEDDDERSSSCLSSSTTTTASYSPSSARGKGGGGEKKASGGRSFARAPPTPSPSKWSQHHHSAVPSTVASPSPPPPPPPVYFSHTHTKELAFARTSVETKGSSSPTAARGDN